MSGNKIRRSPLQLPVNSAEFLRTFVFDRAPTPEDRKNFKITDLWIQRNPEGSPPYGYFVLVDRPNQSAVWLDIGGTQSGDVQTLTGDTGGPISPDVNGDIEILGGSNITTSGSGSSITIDNTQIIPPILPSFTWSVDTTTPINVNVNEGHISNGGAGIIYNLPSTSSVGDGFAFLDLGGNGFTITALGGQTVRLGNQISSSGGTMQNTLIGDAVFLVCAVANTTFLGYAAQGNFNFT